MGKEKKINPDQWTEVYEKWRKGELNGREAAKLLDTGRSTFYERVKLYETQRQIIRTEEEKKAASSLMRLKQKKRKSFYPDNWEEVYNKWSSGSLKSKEAIKLLAVSDTTFYERVKQYEREHNIVRERKGRRPEAYPDNWDKVYKEWQSGILTAWKAADLLKVPYKSFYNMALRYETEQGIYGKRFGRSVKYKGLERVCAFSGKNAVKILEYNDYLERNILPRVDYERLYASCNGDRSYAKGIFNRLYQAMILIYGDHVISARIRRDTDSIECVFVPGVISRADTQELCLALLTISPSEKLLLRAELLTQYGCCLSEDLLKEGQDKLNAAIKENNIYDYGYVYYENNVKKSCFTGILASAAYDILDSFQEYEANLLFEGVKYH